MKGKPVNIRDNSGIYDVVVRGHTHCHHVECVNGTLVVNHGQVRGPFTGRSTVVFIDTSDLEVEIVEIGRCTSIRDIMKGRAGPPAP